MYGKTLADFPDRQEGFMFVLSALPLDTMDAGFAACMNTCSEFPVPQEVHAAALKWQLANREAESARQVVDRPNKPADFEPVSNAGGMFSGMKIKGKVTKEEIAQWLEEGKAKGRARRAELAKDPAWCLGQARCGAPEYKHLLTAAANVTAGLPEDPDGRRLWARDKAVKNGWVEAREPGEEG